MQVSIEFLITSLIVVVSPGSGVIYTVATGLSLGTKDSFIAATGCTLGIIPHLLASMLGLAVIFHTSAYAFNVLKVIGTIYLLYMAWMSLREKGILHFEAKEGANSTVKIIGYAILINLFNPKLPLFLLAFLPQFISVHTTTPMRDMLELSAIFMLITQVVFMLYGAFAALMRRRVLEQPAVLKWLRRIFAIGFVGLSIKLLFSSR